MVKQQTCEEAQLAREAGIITILNTNGHGLAKKVRSAEKRGVPFDLRYYSKKTDRKEPLFNIIGISIDGGSPEVHRAMRSPISDLGLAVEAACWVGQQPDTDLKIASVLGRPNASHRYIDELADLIGDLAPSRLRVYEHSERDDGKNGAGTSLSLEPGKFGELVSRLQTRIGGKVPIFPAPLQSVTGCLLIDPEGWVKKPAMPRSQRLGHIDVETIDDILSKDPKFANMVMDYKRWQK
jgi:hypothetical protein